MTSAPKLKGQALAAVRHRGSPMQIIASAGSGKTEVVAQRVADLLARDKVPAEGIVAFTFTEKAAAELKLRIQQRAVERLGEAVLGQLPALYVGTIHAYCFQLLQRFVPRYEAYDVLDENQLAGLLAREGRTLGVRELDDRSRLFAGIQTFLANVDVVENELIDPKKLRQPFKGIYVDYVDRLDNFRALTFGQIIARAVNALDVPAVRREVTKPLRHLIVDEYQDINPAQERLIQLLTHDGAELCVVGDDDQAIYQWRGTDVKNIISFKDRYRGAVSFTIATNRRSRPEIVRTANACARKIDGRLAKQMKPDRDGGRNEVVAWSAPNETEQARTIAEAIAARHQQGYRYGDIAVLLRSRTSLPTLLVALEDAGIPVKPGGRTNLFLQADAQLFGRLCAWLADHDWRAAGYGAGELVTLQDLVADLAAAFTLGTRERRLVKTRLEHWKQEVAAPTERANLVRDFYALLEALGVKTWDMSDARVVARLGTLARCSQILADFESVRRRARLDPDRPGELIGGQDRGEWHYRWLAIYVQNYALGAYEDFDGEDLGDLDAVEVTTIHQAKGLEWPIVFVPSLIARRFPSSNTGKSRSRWYVSTRLFSEERYNGTYNDERRLFYVALTRARDQLLLSTFGAYNSGKAASLSPLLAELGLDVQARKRLPAASVPARASVEDAAIEVSVSDLVAYDSCGLSYRLRTLMGFQPTLAPEIGYGRAVHHILRSVADHVREHDRVPTSAQLDAIFDEEFYLPAATKATHTEMKRAARTLVRRYLDDYAGELHRVWAVERPFELRLDGALISGRADVILDEHGNGHGPRLTLVDYKTAHVDGGVFDFQLQVYADAGRVEGLNVVDAYVHDLKRGDRQAVAVDQRATAGSRKQVNRLVTGLRRRKFPSKPGDACRMCDVAQLCRDSTR